MKLLDFGISLILSLLMALQGYSQENDTTTNVQDQVDYDFIFIGSKFNDRFVFMGRDFGQRIPTFSSDIMYFFNSGWYINTSALKFMEPDIPYQYAISLGYHTELNNLTELNASYSQFLVSGSSSIVGIQNLGFLQATIGLDWNYLYSTMQVQGLLKENPDLFITSKHSRYFEFDQKLFNHVTVSFEPSVTFVLGTSRFYYLGVFEGGLSEVEGELNKFQPLNWEFTIPLTFEWKNWGIEFQARYVHPLNTIALDESRNRMIYGGQLSYTLPIKKTK